jgi:hypothetical protein
LREAAGDAQKPTRDLVETPAVAAGGAGFSVMVCGLLV